MSYKRIITIREEPIRRNLADLGETEELAIEIGRGVLGISAEPGYDKRLTGPRSRPLPFYRESDVFVPVRSVRPDHFGALAWTGTRLGVVYCDGPEGIDMLTGLSSLFGNDHVLVPDPTDYLCDHPHSENGAEAPVIASIWTVDQTFTQSLAHLDPEDWPARSVGASVLWQMRRQEDVSREIGALHRTNASQCVRKCFDITAKIFAPFVWVGSLKRAADIDVVDRREIIAAVNTSATWMRDGDEFGLDEDLARLRQTSDETLKLALA